MFMINVYLIDDGMEALIVGYVVESMPAASALFFTVAALATGALAVYLYVPWWRVRGVPGPPAFPLVGHIPLLAKHGPDVFAVLAKRYGPIYRFHMGRQPLIIVTDPELCREVGIKKFKSIPNRSVPSALASSPIHLKGLFLTRGSRWQSMRNVIISIYQPSHLAGLVPAIQPYLDRAARLLRPSEEDGVAFSDIALRLFTDTIGQVAFGVDFGLTGADRSTASAPEDAAADDFIQKHLYSTTSLKMDLSGSLSIMLGQLVPFLQRPARALLLRVPGTADRLIRDTNEAISERLDEIVAARAARAERGQKDFLSVVLSASEGGEEMRRLLTPDYVSALTFEHLLAGSTTMSFTLSSLLYLVAMHPEVEEKLLREVDAFGPKDVVPTAEELQTKFPYLEQVLKETMRFFMVSPLIARETSENVEIGGCAIPKGTWVWLAPGVMAKDPAHFPEPEAFRPERFDPGSEECRRRHPYAFIPFGIGPRVCIGQRFSVQQLKLAAVHLYRRFVFRHSPEMEHPLQFQYGIVVNFKHGVKLQVVGRQAS